MYRFVGFLLEESIFWRKKEIKYFFLVAKNGKKKRNILLSFLRNIEYKNKDKFNIPIRILNYKTVIHRPTVRCPFVD